MGCDWTATTLGELCAKQGGSIQTGPFGSQLHASDYGETGTPVVMPVNLVHGNVSENGIARVSKEHVTKLSRHKLQPSDIVFSRRGDVTRFAQITEQESGWLCGTGCLKISLGKEQFAVPQFIAGVLSLPETKAWLIQHAVGATMPNLNTGILSAIPMRLPSLTAQYEVASFLKVMKERIDLLRQTNTTLEAIAQALFKSWFVDFDPVHAKAEGREPEAMDAATAALFPSEFEELEPGLIPKGWRTRPLDSVATYLNGLALQKFPAESEDEFLPVIKIAQLRAGNTAGSDRASAHLKPEYVVHDGDVLFSWSGSLEVEFWCGGDGALNQHLFKVTSDEAPKWFYYLATRMHLPEFRRVAAGKATTMGHIQRKHLTQAKVAVPPPEVLSATTKIVEPLLDRRITNSLQMRELAQLRDTLLPRLISGKLRLPEATEATKASLA